MGSKDAPTRAAASPRYRRNSPRRQQQQKYIRGTENERVSSITSESVRGVVQRSGRLEQRAGPELPSVGAELGSTARNPSQRNIQCTVREVFIIDHICIWPDFPRLRSSGAANTSTRTVVRTFFSFFLSFFSFHHYFYFPAQCGGTRLS